METLRTGQSFERSQNSRPPTHSQGTQEKIESRSIRDCEKDKGVGGRLPMWGGRGSHVHGCAKVYEQYAYVCMHMCHVLCMFII